MKMYSVLSLIAVSAAGCNPPAVSSLSSFSDQFVADCNKAATLEQLEYFSELRYPPLRRQGPNSKMFLYDLVRHEFEERLNASGDRESMLSVLSEASVFKPNYFDDDGAVLKDKLSEEIENCRGLFRSLLTDAFEDELK